MKELKTYLSINSSFSAISGIVMLFLGNKLNSLFLITNPYVFPIIGSNLLVFATFVWYVARKQLSNKKLVSVITLLDTFWVLGSFIIVLLNPFNLSSTGNVLIILVAIWIAFLAFKQHKNNK